MKTPVRPTALLLICVSALWALPCLAGAPSLSPGLWDYTSNTTGSGVVMPPNIDRMPPAMREKFRQAMINIETKPHTIKYKQCLTAEKIAHMKWGPSSDGKCKSTVTQTTADTWNFSEHCPDNNGAQIEVTGSARVANSRHIEWDGQGEVRMGGQVHHMKSHGEGRWVSADCGNVK